MMLIRKNLWPTGRQTKSLLLLDAHYLSHRAKHIFGELQHKGSLTGVCYGLFLTVLEFMSIFQTKDVVFCWDSKTNRRRTLYPGYKGNRQKELTPEELQFEQEFRRQIQTLRTKYLPQMGFRNNFIQTGYEADDIIAALVSKYRYQWKHKIIIVTSDHDLYQCIQPNVHCYNPQTHTRLTEKGFTKLYGLPPGDWAIVKAMAGCSSDNVRGIDGVGEKTAIAYLCGELPVRYKSYLRIKQSKGLIRRNLRIVKLPLKGTKTRVLKPNRLNQSGWDAVTKSIGMKGIRLRSYLNGVE